MMPWAAGDTYLCTVRCACEVQSLEAWVGACSGDTGPQPPGQPVLWQPADATETHAHSGDTSFVSQA